MTNSDYVITNEVIVTTIQIPSKSGPYKYSFSLANSQITGLGPYVSEVDIFDKDGNQLQYNNSDFKYGNGASGYSSMNDNNTTSWTEDWRDRDILGVGDDFSNRYPGKSATAVGTELFTMSNMSTEIKKIRIYFRSGFGRVPNFTVTENEIDVGTVTATESSNYTDYEWEIPPPPQSSLSFENDVLILNDLHSDHIETIIEKKDGASVNVGKATDIVPSEPGEYRAVIKSASSWTFTEYVNVAALGSPPAPKFEYDSGTYNQFGFYYTYDSTMSKSYISPDGSKVFVNRRGHVSPHWYNWYSSYDFTTKTETQYHSNFDISSQAHVISNDTLIVPRNSTIEKLTSATYSSLDSIDTNLGSINHIYDSFNVSFDENNTTVISLCRNTSNKYMITEFKRVSSAITARLVKDITDEIPSTTLYFFNNEGNGTYDVISGYTGSITIYRYSVTNKTDLEIELKETIVMNSLPYTNNYYRPMGKRFMIHDNSNQVTIYNTDKTVFASNTNIRNGQSTNRGPYFWTIDDRYFGINFSRGTWGGYGGSGWQGIIQYIYIYDSHDISTPHKTFTKGAFGNSGSLWGNSILGAYIKVHNGEIVHFWSNQHYAYVQKMKIYENPTYFL